MCKNASRAANFKYSTGSAFDADWDFPLRKSIVICSKTVEQRDGLEAPVSLLGTSLESLIIQTFLIGGSVIAIVRRISGDGSASWIAWRCSCGRSA
jgi:hypothetical protein